MFALEWIRGKILTPSRRERFAYFRSVSLKRLWVLAAAAFFLFAAIGLLASLINTNTTRLADGLVWAGIGGITAILYIFVTARKPIWLPAVIAFQFLANFAVIRLLKWLHSIYPPEPFAGVVQIYAIAALLFSCLAYTLFFAFIQTEGRTAIRAQTELALAHGIQKTLAPVIHSQIAGCEIYGISVPSEKVGGDLVDLVPLPDGTAFAYLADIAGHGLQAGILMGMVKTAARARLLDIPAPKSLFESLNRVLPGVKEAHMYATCAAMHLIPSEAGGCDVEYALAGHGPILHFSASGQVHQPLADEQFPLGILSFADYRSHTMHAAKGDLLVAVTDGILEVTQKNDIEFGIAGLDRILAAHARAPLPNLAQRILEAVNTWGKQYDDQTLLLIRVL